MNYNNTEPLPYASNIDNKIYEFNPFLEDECLTPTSVETSSPLKRAKSTHTGGRKVSANSLSASFSKLSSPRKSISRSPSFKNYGKRKLRFSPPPINPSSSTNIHNLSKENSFHGLEFSFCSGFAANVSNSVSTSDNSDLESLPDLTEDDGTPHSTPTKSKSGKSYFFQDPIPLRKFNFDNIATNPVVEKSPPPLPPPIETGPSIFDVPELVYKIVEYASLQSTNIPQESTPIRRKPLSYDHAMLIHGSRQRAELALKETKPSEPHHQLNGGILYMCLQVNKLFHQVTSEILSKSFYFSDEIQFNKLASTVANSQHKIKFKPTMFVLHKLFMLKQNSIDLIKNHIDFSDLEWLELYMCPKLYPTIEFFINGGHKLKKLIITGSKVVDDDFLFMVSKYCPNLEVLDIRACELVTDAGIYQIAKNCHKLTTINLGRKQRGNLITDNSLLVLINNNKNLSTVGLAGCHISDKTIWDLAINCSHTIQRLSLNYCPFILNQSIPLIMTRLNNGFPSGYFNNLSVLELRFNHQITNWQPIIEFKRRQEYQGISMLIEVCETLMIRMRQQELEMDKLISQGIFRDILDWVNDEDDGDLSYHELLEARRSAAISAA